MKIKYFGPDDFIANAFENIPEDDGLDVLEATSTRLVVRHPDTGAVTIFTGTGFTYSNDGTPTGGTVTGIDFQTGSGDTVAQFLNMAWAFPDVVAMVDAIDAGDDSLFIDLLNQQKVILDASRSDGMDITEDGVPFLRKPFTFIGSDGDDRIVGSTRDDLLEPNESAGYDVIFGSQGDDTINYTDSLNGYQELNYSRLGQALDVAINGAANTATIIKGTRGTDSFVDIENPLNSGWYDGGLGIYGSARNDSFTITMGSEQWMQVAGGAGRDSFNLDTSAGGVVRVDYRWDGDMGPTNGVVINLGKNKALDDGFGDRDNFNLTQGSGRVEFRLTDMDDTFVGSNDKDRVILRQGNDVANGKGGWDTVRYDRSGVDNVEVDLGAGTATGIWNGQIFNHSLLNFEEIRGSRTGDDSFTGDNGDNLWDGRGGYGIAHGSRGNDTYVYWNTGGDYQDLNYASLNGGVDVVINGATGTGTVDKGNKGFDTLEGIQNILAEGWVDGGLGIYGTAGGDSFTIDGGVDTWMQVSGGAGRDVFDIVLSGWVRLNFGWDGASGPTGGIDIDVGRGKVFDDGFGGRDILNITDGAGKLQIRGTGFDDVMKGSDLDEDFMGEGGNNTIDGGRGDHDRVRYDRNGIDSVEVNLKTGVADFFYNGTAYQDTIRRIEDVRGSREGADVIIGSNADNNLQGRGGKDVIKGGGGADHIWGEADNDKLFGGADGDVFHYSVGVDEGRDLIVDFEDGLDLIRLGGGSMSDVSIDAVGGGADTRLVFSGGTVVILKDVVSTDIDASDFIF